MKEPPEIKRLDESVINRIAAGEVIQRPANALKEMIENSLDAKSTNIQIMVKNGGLKLLQIQDNGTGIRKEDFEIVCERFTTSKLTAFEDLQSIATYGFRGEALASISHIAHLTIISKTTKDICAYQALYVDGQLQGTPKPIAGNQGTIITVEDLFYNMNVRRKALRSPAEEYQKVSEVVSKYAIHNSAVGFSLKKSNDNNDIRTPQNSNVIENIRIIYGSTVARELIEFSLKNQPFKFKVSGYITNVNYSTKKFNFLLFINHRLVDCQSLKKSIDQVYTTYLPKNMHPFVYLSLELDPTTLDVNVHPTKYEVHFLNEEQIVEATTIALESKLLGSNNSRKFYTQAKLPGVQVEPFPLKDKDCDNKNKTINAKDLVRTDATNQKLEKFFGAPIKKSDLNNVRNQPDEEMKNAKDTSLDEEVFKRVQKEYLEKNEKFECMILNTTAIPDESSNKESGVHNSDNLDAQTSKDNKVEAKSKPKAEVKPRECLSKAFISKLTRVETELTSVLELRKHVEQNCHHTLRETFAQHVFVGCVDPGQALIQHSTKLYLCNTQKILEELFYQFVLYNFQNFPAIVFPEPLPLCELAMIALDQPETGWTEADGDKKELSNTVVQLLEDKSSMLMEYFSMEIENGNLKSIPQLLDHYLPSEKLLPMYILRLTTEVNWETEKECFRTFARETALFYSEMDEDSTSEGNDWKWITEHVWYPAVKEYFIPPKTFVENAAVLEIASLPNLYKVFERC